MTFSKPTIFKAAFVFAPWMALSGIGCNKSGPLQSTTPTDESTSVIAEAKPISSLPPAPTAAATSSTAAVPEAAETVLVGQTAPDFSLPDLDGRMVSLSQYKGKRVVLEWFNPDCPFVKAAHTRGSLVNAGQKYAEKGVVWLAINSNAKGKQGHGAEANRRGQEEFGITYPILLDETGQVGKAYGATNTPHMFVIDENGVVVYAGAIDNSPDGEGQSPSDGKLRLHVAEVLDELEAGKPISVPRTKAYGCGVKYGS